jgi:prevent-host-death family protein
MAAVNVHEAKTHLSKLVDDVKKGKEHVIAKAGKPVARLVPMRSGRPARAPGFLKGKIKISPKFDAPLPAKVAREFLSK